MLEDEFLKGRTPRSIIDISQISSVRKYISEFSNLESDYLFTRLTAGSERPQFINGPVRINGLILCFVAKGYMNLDVNLTNTVLQAGSFIMATSSAIINIRELDCANLDAYVVVISPDFLRDINIDLNVLQSTKLQKSDTPVMTLTEQESALLLRYMGLLHTNTTDNTGHLYIRSISRCLIASIIYQLMEFSAVRTSSHEDGKVTHPFNRRTNYVHDFMELLYRFHKQERSVAFYADKLFITPKYLSLIIKESTGRTAAEWIDEYVILEAKNMLRFSRKNIQQIAYELNFSNQSSFGKYFKNLTGMSPSAYQRS